MLYHCSRSLLGAGDLIHRGTWGRLVLGGGPAHSNYYREYILENIRKREFPTLPSRMEVAFAFEDCAFAIKWQRDRVQEYVYAAEVCDPQSAAHAVDMEWVDSLMHCRSFESVDELARSYWRGEERRPGNREKFEVLVAGDLRIVDRITRIEEDGKT